MNETASSVRMAESPGEAHQHGHGLRERAEQLFKAADVRVNGDRPWDFRVHDERTFARAFAHGSLGLGEAYMDGWWDCEDLDGFFFRVLDAHLDDHLKNFDTLRAHLRARFINLATGRRPTTWMMRKPPSSTWSAASCN